MPMDIRTYLGGRIQGTRRACNRANRMVLLNTLDFLAEQLLALQNDEMES